MSNQKVALVLGAGGFIGSHMVKRLKSEGFTVVGADLKTPDFGETLADKFRIGDLRDPSFVNELVFDETYAFSQVYQFAADMGGAGYVFTGEHDADIMHNSALINLNVLDSLTRKFHNSSGYSGPKVFYSSSACMYPEFNQKDPNNLNLSEASAYPALPDSEYGWEKLFSERLYQSFSRNYGLPIAIARYHNIYGPEGTFEGGKEKAPAALSRKIARIRGTSGEIEVWGDGKQTRSFLFIEDCIEATRRLMESNFQEPVNIGSEEMVEINFLVELIAQIAGKDVSIRHIPNGPVGVRGRNSDNTLIRKVLNWEYEWSLRRGLEATYSWISSRVA